MQIAESQFAQPGLGHAFRLRVPLSKVGASRCATCDEDIFAHARHEVADADALAVLNAKDDKVASLIEPNLMVGGFKAAIAECDRHPNAVVINTAGRGLHSFLPNSAAPFDALRAAKRVLDLEWEDREDFELELEPILGAIRWARAHIDEEQKTVVINCAQGKSRSGTLATAFLMFSRDLGCDEALGLVRDRRPLVQPNTGFMKQLRQLEGAIRQAGRDHACDAEEGEAKPGV